jgi:hypothetical protein
VTFNGNGATGESMANEAFNGSGTNYANAFTRTG